VVRRERGLGAREKHPRKAADKLHVSTRTGCCCCWWQPLVAGLATHVHNMVPLSLQWRVFWVDTRALSQGGLRSGGST
jgi:hypothetical protein